MIRKYLFWIFVWPLFPFLGMFGKKKRGKLEQDTLWTRQDTLRFCSVALSGLWFIFFLLCAVPIFTELNLDGVQPEQDWVTWTKDGQTYTNVRVTFVKLPVISGLPWSWKQKERYIRCEVSSGSIFWLKEDTGQRVYGMECATLNVGWAWYQSRKERAERHRKNREMLHEIREHIE